MPLQVRSAIYSKQAQLSSRRDSDLMKNPLNREAPLIVEAKCPVWAEASIARPAGLSRVSKDLLELS